MEIIYLTKNDTNLILETKGIVEDKDALINYYINICNQLRDNLLNNKSNKRINQYIKCIDNKSFSVFDYFKFEINVPNNIKIPNFINSIKLIYEIYIYNAYQLMFLYRNNSSISSTINSISNNNYIDGTITIIEIASSNNNTSYIGGQIVKNFKDLKPMFMHEINHLKKNKSWEKSQSLNNMYKQLYNLTFSDYYGISVLAMMIYRYVVNTERNAYIEFFFGELRKNSKHDNILPKKNDIQFYNDTIQDLKLLNELKNATYTKDELEQIHNTFNLICKTYMSINEKDDTIFVKKFIQKLIYNIEKFITKLDRAYDYFNTKYIERK